MSKVNENGFESDEEEQFYLNKLREQAKEEDAMEEMSYVFFLEEQCVKKDQRIAELEKKLDVYKKALELISQSCASPYCSNCDELDEETKSNISWALAEAEKALEELK